MLSTSDLPVWLVTVSWASLAIAVVSAGFITVDVLRRPQPMTVMALVWPICALFGSLLWVGAYLAWGRAPRRGGAGESPQQTGHDGDETADGDHHGHEGGHSANLGMSEKPRTMATSVFVGTSHCGAGCTLADLLAEWVVFAIPAIAVAGGLNWLFTDTIFAVWVLAYVCALVIGIGFQYFAIAPMNPDRGRATNLRMAGRADFLSLTAWQLGMYATMAIAQLALFPVWLGGAAAVNTPVFWVVMQAGMVVGFATSYPVNWWLIHKGIKERM